MKKYLITLYPYIDSVNILVEAEDEEEALSLVKDSGWEYRCDNEPYVDIQLADITSEEENNLERFYIDLDLT